MKTQIPTQAEYEANELRAFRKQLAQVESSPLADRREARRNWQTALTDTPLIAKRMSWLLCGNYGYGAMKAAQSVAQNKRMNRAAQLGQWLAALEWNCPADFARQAWNSLAPEHQNAVNAAIMEEVESWIAEQGKE